MLGSWKFRLYGRVDPRFFHLDTCFALLRGGHVLYFPDAVDAQGSQKVESSYPPNRRIAISEAGAVQFSCNVINAGAEVILHAASSRMLAQAPGRILLVVAHRDDEYYFATTIDQRKSAGTIRRQLGGEPSQMTPNDLDEC